MCRFRRPIASQYTDADLQTREGQLGVFSLRGHARVSRSRASRIRGRMALGSDCGLGSAPAATLQPLNVLGQSDLFGNYDTQPVAGDETRIQGDNPEEVDRFISSSGAAVALKRKAALNEPAGPLYAQGHSTSTSWKDDDFYGININALLDKIEAQAHDNDATGGDEEEEQGDGGLHKGEPQAQKLWVEKWRPKSFVDLIGNEKSDRILLAWLRQWSFAAFKEEPPNPPKAEDSNDDKSVRDIDPYQRPYKRILLIHGPPGIGKTSVAHILAKHAGFAVSEINASDERAGPLVKQKVQNTLFNHTFNDRPVCLVADEIDGSIESGFVKVLLDILYQDGKATNQARYRNMQSTFSKKKKNKKTSKVLLRPIVAICNNLYAPALEKLRPHCQIISFKRPADSALQERLQHICKSERLLISKKVVNNLIDLSQGDVRNCINNLQFLSKQKYSDESILSVKSNEEIEGIGSNQKDTSMSWFKVVNDIFKKDNNREVREQFYEVLKNVEMNGNYDRIVQGCFALYPTVKYSDNGVKKPASITDWLYFQDLMHKSLYTHNGELLRYCPTVPLSFFHHFGDVANKTDQRIKNPEYEQREILKQNSDIVSSIQDGVSSVAPKRSTFLNQKTLVNDILPFLDHMLSVDVLKVKDNKMKVLLIDRMLAILEAFQLSINQMENELTDSRPILTIDPPIDKIVVFDSKKIKEIVTKRPHVLNLLFAKSEENKVKKRHIDKVTKEKAALEDNKYKNKKARTFGSNSVDFFKKQYESINLSSQSETGNSSAKHVNNNFTPGDTTPTPKDSVRIWVRYKSGFSNAVRKNVSWDALWQ
ncbi:Ctf18p KNAG_0C05730 [Huiozyma naganishii CBS 8797]|uniref:AAA+ ATPase domain-containing protein n=1 Tax=Huiozyma naganishii (strain ATCC MYA-139 / BCRC 22969 / CBS 8797 / KCTC 17520 / NBRC 10181 / NCYC 3082 / Yp74L-3) TaxID=1071383 RepID=J7S6C4_HUIN7|nr:hypothetical protein KNAG_0C05730 [Kazachstania naganishii CBS 8797]CCK69671.1 hypothetical protein KNAG_0C05730 [Kazachstania naganishii CBS 8797]